MTSTARPDQVWQQADTVQAFLSGVRGGIPFAVEQISIALAVMERAFATLHPDGSDRAGLPLTVADLGCGDGAIAQAVLSRYPQVQVMAIDFSAPMLEQAQQKLYPFRDRVTLMQADLYHSTWQETLGQFDAILSGYCIHHLPHDRKQALYQEIFDHLNPGGCFLNIEHVASASPWLESTFNELLVDSIYQWHQRQGMVKSREEVAQQFVYRDDKQANILAPVETQCEWLRTIGFQQVDCYFKFFELAVFGGIKAA